MPSARGNHLLTKSATGSTDKRSTGGKGVRILTGTITSPTLAWQIQRVSQQFPQARWQHYDPLARVNTLEGARLAFGRPLNTVYQFRRFDQDKKPTDAKVIVSLDSDFLWEEPGSLQYDRHFIAARQVRVRHWWQTTMNRLYMIESTFSITGTMADHRLPAEAVGDSGVRPRSGGTVGCRQAEQANRARGGQN